MATLVTFHAHPDDEAIACGGTMARAAAEGHRVVLVVATRGEHGEVPDAFLDEGETLADRRTRETEEAARILGVHRVAFLAYVDSGMMGWPQNDDPASFWQADVEEAATRLAAILTEESADVLTVYDKDGVYGHPDHIQVHRVGVRAAELAGTPRVYESTIDRERVKILVAAAVAAGEPVPVDDDLFYETLGVPSSMITTRVDVTGFLQAKRKAMAAHASQISETSYFLNMNDDAFALAWGIESYVRQGAPEGTDETWLFDGTSS